MIKNILKKSLAFLGYNVSRIIKVNQAIPDREFYRPLFSPWIGYGEFKYFWRLAEPLTLTTADCCYILYSFALLSLNLKGEFWECGVFKGGTALMLAEVIQKKAKQKKILRLFDTFGGMPSTDRQKDYHQEGDFSDCSLKDIEKQFSGKDFVCLHSGWIPDSFQGLEDTMVALAHIDVDIYQSVFDCCQFIYPRLETGGVLIFDDYGRPSCPGARIAADEFFLFKPEKPIVLPTGQALIIKAPKIVE